MEEIRLHRLGYEKLKKFEDNFDLLYDKYKKKALLKGFPELKFIKERGKVIIYAVINDPDL